MNIGILDSGLGGVFVLKHLYKKYPYHNYIYFGDTKHLPYGSKSRTQLKSYLHKIIPFLKEQGAERFVIACNTISSLLPEYIRELTQVPTVNVLEATVSNSVKVIQQHNINNVLLIGTEGTIRAKKYYNNIKDKLPNININDLATPEFVPIVEENRTLSRETYDIIAKYFGNFIDTELIILGCTHYEALVPVIKDFYSSHLKTPYFISSAETVALEYEDFFLGEKSELSLRIFISKKSSVFTENVKLLFPNCSVEVKDIF